MGLAPCLFWLQQLPVCSKCYIGSRIVIWKMYVYMNADAHSVCSHSAAFFFLYSRTYLLRLAKIQQVLTMRDLSNQPVCYKFKLILFKLMSYSSLCIPLSQWISAKILTSSPIMVCTALVRSRQSRQFVRIVPVCCLENNIWNCN